VNRRWLDKVDLTERERKVADVAINASRDLQHQTLRRVILGMGFAVLLSIAGGVTGWALVERESSSRAEQIKEESRARDLSIQSSRRENLIRNCEESNARNRATKEQLRIVSAKRPMTTDEKRRLAATILLIDALVPPRESCEEYADARLRLG
jgi:hypothetical protein